MSGGGSLIGLTAFAEASVKLQVIMPSNVQDFPDGVTEDDNFVVDYWREKTGYDFDVVVLSNEDADTQLATMLNAGEVEGIIVTRNAANVGKFASEGLIANLDDYKDSCTLYSMNDCTAGIYDGAQYAFCQGDSINYCTNYGQWYVNRDIAEELGFDHSPATYDEFVDFLYKAKDAGYMPLAMRGDPGLGDSGSTFALLQGIYGLGGGEYGVTENNEVYYKYITDQAKAYLEFCAKLYADGIIPADFASQTEDGMVEMLLSKQAASGSCITVWNTGVMNQSEELGMDIKFADYPTDINGAKSYSTMNNSYGATSLIFMIAEGCEYMDECIELINLWCTDEAINLANYGIEGTHYEYDENGEMVVLEAANDFAWGVYYRVIHRMDYWYPVYGVGANWAEYFYPSERNTTGCPYYDPIIHMSVDSERVQLLTDLRKNIIVPYYTNVVMGNDSIDNWDNMVEQWKSQGGEELMKFYTEAYQANGCPTSEYWTTLPDEHPAYTGKYLYGGAEAAAAQETWSDYFDY